MADGAILLSDRRCEVMSELLTVCYYFSPANKAVTPYHVVHKNCKFIKIFSGFKLCLPTKKKLCGISAKRPTKEPPITFVPSEKIKRGRRLLRPWETTTVQNSMGPEFKLFAVVVLSFVHLGAFVYLLGQLKQKTVSISQHYLVSNTFIKTLRIATHRRKSNSTEIVCMRPKTATDWWK